MKRSARDRKSTRLNSSHTVIYTLSLHDALPICFTCVLIFSMVFPGSINCGSSMSITAAGTGNEAQRERSEEHTSELQSHRDLHSFPTRRSSDLFYLCIDLFDGISWKHQLWIVDVDHRGRHGQ